MASYALLVLPAANRVYAEAAVGLTLAELDVFNQTVLGGRLADVTSTTIAGVPYVCFSADQLTDRDVAFLANASSIFALFARVGDALRPVELTPLDRFDDDIVTIPKYPGKTNEHFTKLLLNVTVLSSAFGPEMLGRPIRVLDPLCGRGTTLNQALRYGFDAAGVDVDRKDFEAYSAFIQTYLKRKRIKHRAELGPVRRERKVVARRLRVTLAATKEGYRAGQTNSLEVINADTTRSLDFFRPDSFDVVATDAPYGVQHGSRTPATGLARGPLDLLTAAVPVWTRLLRPGGALGLSWNTLLARREQAAQVLTGAGLVVLDSAPYRAFRHRVDQAITRDILVARKPDPLSH